MTLDRQRGQLTSLVYEGVEVLRTGPAPNFWRAPTDNDYGNDMPQRLGVWRSAGPDRVVEDVSYRQNSDRDVVSDIVARLNPGGSRLATSYHVYGSGDIIVTQTLTLGRPGLPDLPRFGMTLTMPAEFDTMTWFGRGPHETYWDRKSGARVGVYRGNVIDQYTPYIRPQENGNKTDVRWVALTNRAGFRLLAVGMPVLDVSAYPFLNEDFDAGDAKRQRHTTDVKRARARHAQPRLQADGRRWRYELGGAHAPRVHATGQGVSLPLPLAAVLADGPATDDIEQRKVLSRAHRPQSATARKAPRLGGLERSDAVERERPKTRAGTQEG